VDGMIHHEAIQGWPMSLIPLQTIPGSDMDATVPTGSSGDLDSGRGFHFPRADELVELSVSDAVPPLRNRSDTIDRLAGVARTDGPFAGQSRYDAPSDTLGHWPTTTPLDAGDALDRTPAASAWQPSTAASGIAAASRGKAWDQHDSWPRRNQADFYSPPLGMLKYHSDSADHAPTTPYAAYGIPAATIWPPAGAPAPGWWTNAAGTENVWRPRMSSSSMERSRGLPTRNTKLLRPSASESPWIGTWTPVPLGHPTSPTSTLEESSPADGYSGWRSMEFPAAPGDY
jgi:hypothetical protein